MTEEQDKIFATLEVRARDLIRICERQKARIVELENELKTKEEELQDALNTISSLKMRNNDMLIARVVSPNSDELKNAKTQLSRLIKEVDRCIALLNE
jgi:urease accessory protein UreH